MDEQEPGVLIAIGETIMAAPWISLGVLVAVLLFLLFVLPIIIAHVFPPKRYSEPWQRQGESTLRNMEEERSAEAGTDDKGGAVNQPGAQNEGPDYNATRGPNFGLPQDEGGFAPDRSKPERRKQQAPGSPNPSLPPVLEPETPEVTAKPEPQPEPIEEGGWQVDTGSSLSESAGSAPPETDMAETGTTEEDDIFEETDSFLYESSEEEDAEFENVLGRMKDNPATEQGLASLEPPQPVDVSVFTPKRVRPMEAFIIQAVFHAEDQEQAAAAMAADIDPSSERRLVKSLNQMLRSGQMVTASLEVAGSEIDYPIQNFQWSGQIEPLQFVVTVPDNADTVSVLCKLRIFVDDAPVASSAWRMAVTPQARVAEEVGAYVPVNRFRKAFVSYTSHDRLEVLKRVQGLEAAGVEVFQDVLDLEPGVRWEKKLYQHIDEADAFILCWSDASSRSEWVAKEWQYALARANASPDQKPDICPVILTVPPPAPPPELADRHFNDILAYVLAAHQRLQEA